MLAESPQDSETLEKHSSDTDQGTPPDSIDIYTIHEKRAGRLVLDPVWVALQIFSLPLSDLSVNTNPVSSAKLERNSGMR